MITRLPAAERGQTRLAWLDSAHSFSFGDYYQPNHNGFGVLRVLNEHQVAANRGFPAQGRANMEILSWVVNGELQHRDNAGHECRLPRGSLQVLSAGAGVRYGEHNDNGRRALHFLQLWLQPDRVNGAPGCAQRHFDEHELRNRLCLLASADPSDDSLPIRQNVRVHGSRLEPRARVESTLSDRRRAWLQVIAGKLQLNDSRLDAGDGASIEHERQLQMTALDSNCEFLLIEMP